MDKKTYYLTTPIYYPSGNWHLGHCYTTVICDAIARYKRMSGYDVFFLTGTDEHGQKIERRALEAKTPTKEFVDTLVDSLKNIWQKLGITYDKFIRTTDDYHIKSVQKIFQTLYEKGEIYKSEYEGLYCTPCEAFWTQSQLVDGNCPDCGRKPTKEKEESYFFRLSKYTDKLLELYEQNPSFLLPKSRVNEMVNNFLKPGLIDLCVSRTSFKWGIPVSFDKGHIVYVWIDALSNYITALGYQSSDTTLFDKYWPADLHLMAKEIVRFHTIIWPALLMALDVPLPKQVFGHGWLLIGGDKLSKSKTGNIKTELVEPNILIDRYGADAIRYFLLREIPFGNDGIYTNESLINRINSDLANDLGNLVSRTTAMAEQYFQGIISTSGEEDAEFDQPLILLAKDLHSKVAAQIDNLNIPEALSEIFKTIQRANKYIDQTMPWLLAKDEQKKERLKRVIYNLCETIRICAVMLKAFMPKTADTILKSLAIEPECLKFYDGNTDFGILKDGIKVTKCSLLFPRIDLKKELLEIEKLTPNKQQTAKKGKDMITIDDFSKIELKVALVTACEKVEKADKLLKLTVKIGDEVRTVVSGIAKSYTPESLVGKKVTLITNLAPAKLRGIESQGMVLCAEDENGKLSLVCPDTDIADGSSIF